MLTGRNISHLPDGACSRDILELVAGDKYRSV